MRRLDPEGLGEHVDVMFRAAWAMCGSREDAEDLVQETFSRVLAKPRVLRGDERGYLMQALRNTFNSRLRMQMRRPQTTVMPEDQEPVDPRGRTPQEQLEAAEILDAIGELPEDFRQALIAVDIAGLSYVEAAELLGAKEATVTTRLHRARRRIAAAFADEQLAGHV